MSKARSNKNKGRKAQQEVRDLLLEAFPELEKDDIRSTSMGCGGEDLQLSPAARKILPFNIEIKHKQSIAACRFMEQAQEHGQHEPVAIFREDRGPWYVCVSIDYFLEAVRRAYELRSKTP